MKIRQLLEVFIIHCLLQLHKLFFIISTFFLLVKSATFLCALTFKLQSFISKARNPGSLLWSYTQIPLRMVSKVMNAKPMWYTKWCLKYRKKIVGFLFKPHSPQYLKIEHSYEAYVSQTVIKQISNWLRIHPATGCTKLIEIKHRYSQTLF